MWGGDKMEFEERMDEFEEKFVEDGYIGGALLAVLDSEGVYERWMMDEEKWRHQQVEALQGFVIHTLKLASERFAERPVESKVELFRVLLAWFAAQFRRFRSAELLMSHGYGLVGASLLRDVRDWTISVAALQQGVVTWEDFHGGAMTLVGSAESADSQARHRRMVSAQRTVKDWAWGESSGLDNRSDLTSWTRFENQETHGSLVTTLVGFSDWLDGTGGLPIGPDPNSRHHRLYLSRSLEVGQMMLRVLPILQVDAVMGDEWDERWKLLDAVLSDWWQDEKQVAKYLPAYGELLMKKFDFDPYTTRLAIELGAGAGQGE
jgi:hypothetical protein